LDPNKNKCNIYKSKKPEGNISRMPTILPIDEIKKTNIIAETEFENIK